MLLAPVLTEALSMVIAPRFLTVYQELPAPSALRVRVAPPVTVTVPLRFTRAPLPFVTLSTVPLPVMVRAPSFVMVSPAALVSVLPLRSSVTFAPSFMVTSSVESASIFTLRSVPDAAAISTASLTDVKNSERLTNILSATARLEMGASPCFIPAPLTRMTACPGWAV